jgi:hypothetical protein
VKQLLQQQPHLLNLDVRLQMIQTQDLRMKWIFVTVEVEVRVEHAVLSNPMG